MKNVTSKFTIFFENPFWVGVFENNSDGKYEVCKVTFGSEPTDTCVYSYILKYMNKLKFTSEIKTERTNAKRINPKRMQRAINKDLANTGIGTKAQQALKLQQEANKVVRKQSFKERREVLKKRKFCLKQDKHKEKHRGH